MKKVALRSLGCKVNAYETEGIQQILQKNGYEIVPFDTVADIYIVNTCSVTNIADHKSRQMLHKAKNTNPDAIVVACGCYVQTGLETLKADPAIDIIIGNNEKNNVLKILQEYEASHAAGVPAGETGDTSVSSAAQQFIYVHDIGTDPVYEEMSVGAYTDRTRGFVKIQDGCNRFCTYCVIPYARGRVRSRQQDDVVREVCGMVRDGCREIVLTGIHVSSYGTDRGESELLPLIRRLHEIDGFSRIRLSSLEPGIITPDFAAGISALPKVCPHFHLSMQSGSEGVLARMNRHYTPDEYYERVETLRRVYDDPAITTDVIVGFPGETEEEFEETLRFVEKVGFYELHVFKYSRRDGTIAADMPDQITERVKAQRSQILIDAGHKLSRAYRDAHIGAHTSVLTEEFRTIDGRDYLVGFTPEYICAGIPRDLIEAHAAGTPTAPSEAHSGAHGGAYFNRIVTGTYGPAADAEVMEFIPDDMSLFA